MKVAKNSWKAGAFRLWLLGVVFEITWHVVIMPIYRAKKAELDMNKRTEERKKDFLKAQKEATRENLKETVSKLWKKS